MRIIHLFKWKLNDIIPFLPEIKEQGFDAIQISPIQWGKYENGNDEWWKLYQPYGLVIGNAIGTKEDLISLCAEAKSYKIRIFADVVLNHVANNDDDHLEPNELVQETLKNEIFFKEKRYISNWDDRYELTNFCIGLPSLNLDIHSLQDKVICFLNELIDCGVSGFRIDAAKHMKLPEEGSDFFVRVFDNLKDKNLFNYAEVIFSPEHIIDAYSRYMHVLTDCHSNNPSKVVSYIDSHDLQHEFGVTAFKTSEELLNSYSQLCFRNKKTIFYAREFDDLWRDKSVYYANIS